MMFPFLVSLVTFFPEVLLKTEAALEVSFYGVVRSVWSGFSTI